MIRLRHLFYRLKYRGRQWRTGRIGDKFFILNGHDPISYIDLSTNEKHTYTPEPRFIYDVRVKNSVYDD